MIDYGNYLVWAVWVAFTIYTAYVALRENIFKSLRHMLTLHWGRQVGLDLYIGLSLAIIGIGLLERSIAAAVLWAVPIYLLGNIATLFYVATHYDSIVAFLFP